MEKVLLGLDLGTDSVGWCATDENGKIIKVQGKSLWGYRGFEEACDASERRMNRCNRRRLNRRKERLNLLRYIFKDEINKVDNSFFYRLDNSFYHNEDRTSPFDYTLFNDSHYNDSKYYKDYPTIYHLRKELLESNEKADIRKIYLAMHHMIKYRGNFLSSQENFSVSHKDELKIYFDSLNTYVGLNINFDDSVFEELKEINKSKLTLTQTKEKYNDILNSSNDKKIKNVIIPLMVGSSIKLDKLEIEEVEDLKEIKVTDESFEEHLNKIINQYPDKNDVIETLKACKGIYDFFLLSRLLGENVNGEPNKYISVAMVNRYNRHHDQLEKLKKYVKEFLPEKYDEIFRKLENKLNNYARYIGSTNYLNQKKRESHCTKDEFYCFLKKELGIEKNNDGNSYLSEVSLEISNGTFLERQNGTENGIFPYQLNKIEMNVILEKQSKYYPFLLEKDDEYSNLDKIISLLEFKIPYYVGPLISPKIDEDGKCSERSKFSWIVRTEEKIYPWNFNKVVNLPETAENFIVRMLTNCTYLTSCYCMPKASILYSYYNVLVHLNKINVNGCPINKETKINVINNLYKKNKKVTKKMLEEYFKTIFNLENVVITTSNDKENKNYDFNMGSYCDFCNVFGSEFVDNNLNLIEDIIKDITIFEDKKILTKRLKDKYNLDNDYIKKIKAFNYSNYSNISKELLKDIIYFETDDNGEVLNQKNILDVIEEDNVTLQEVIYNEKYCFDRLIREYNIKNNPELKKQTIEEYVSELSYISPGMKRPLIQAYKIIEEVEKILNHRIDEYYVECTRTNNDKNKGKESKSRKEIIQAFYVDLLKNKSIIESDKNRFEELKVLADSLEPSKFQGDKIYLYFTQLGRCMYSGEIINFEDLMDDSKYDVDHIYPQSLIKDDSIMNNKVLVKQDLNRRKSNIYPIPSEILYNGNRNKANKFYLFLKNNKFITEEKFNRLTKKELSNSEYDNFVNRQLVYTNQAVKCLIEAIKTLKSTDSFVPKVVYSKSENVSEFRHKYNLLKSRNINNFHHAHDAYLNIIVGRAIDYHFSYYQKFYHGGDYIKQMCDNNIPVNVLKIFDQNKENNKRDLINKDNNLIWSYSNSLKEINHNIYERFDIFSTERTYVKNTILKSVTIYPAGKANIPVNNGKLSDYSKYGGLQNVSYGLYLLVKYKNKYRIVAIPTMYKDNQKGKNNYLSNLLKTDNYEIVIPELKVNTVIEVGKKKFVFTGKNSETAYYICNKVERIFSKKEIIIIKKIEKVCDKNSKNNIINENGMRYENNGESLLIYYSRSKEDMDNNIKFKSNILTNEEMMYVYDKMIERLKKDCFSYTATISLLKIITDKRNQFLELSIIDKCLLFMELLNFLKCNSNTRPNLSLLGGSNKSQGTSYSTTLSDCKIVFESITGFYRKEFKLD